jgi:RsiW-degrading membrane proteinase PrsW (M82 family)
MSPGAGLLILCLWTGAAALAQLFYRNPILRWATPCFYLAAVALPVYFFARLATGGLNFGSRQRTWGALGSGLLLGPLLAGGIELALVAVLVLAFAAFSALRPDLSGGLDFLREQLRNASQTDILDLLTRDLLNPIVISLVVLGFCVAGPLVEESAKSLTAWAVFDRLASPAEGFVVGALSGTGFGLVESLLASVQPDAHWAGTLLVRGATAMMHIATSGLTGWGIATFRTSGQARHLVRGYALAFALHGLWNLCVIAVVLAALHAQVAPGSEQFLDGMLVAAGISILALILLAAAFALGLANRRLRAAARIDQPGTQEVE